MKIGIDAKWYHEGPPSGKMVVRNLVNQLLKDTHGHDVFLFLDKKYKNISLEVENDNVKKIYIWAGNNFLSNFFLVPFAARSYQLDVVLFQNFVTVFGDFKKIAHIHDIIFLTHPEYYTRLEKLYFFPLKYVTRQADQVITVSYNEKKRMQQYKYTDKKIDVIYHGVEECFKPILEQSAKLLNLVKSKYNLPEKFILYVGRLNSRKNLPNLLRAYSLIKTKSLPLVLVGSTDWKNENLQILVDELNLSDYLYFVGSVYGEDLGAIYSLATLFCFPSFEESFGLPPLEAMSAGIPVVVSHSSSIPEICQEAGNYVSANDPKDIADKIELLLTDTILYQQKVKEGLRRSLFFSWENSIASFFTILSKM